MPISFPERFRTITNLLSKPRLLKKFVSLYHSGYLVDTGWLNSISYNKPINKNMEPIPWATYPFSDFLTPRLKKSFDIFEFGSGYSTLFFANKVNSVTSIEHDWTWYNNMVNQIPGNCNLIFADKNIAKYEDFVTLQNKLFDIIFIDAVFRNECSITSVQKLKSDGIIVLDNSELAEYTPGKEFLVKCGFKFIDFWGMTPCINYKMSTTIFYRSNNCLGI